MRADRITMALSYNGEEVATATVPKFYSDIEKQRYRWVHTYGLTPKKDWEIYIKVESSMGKYTDVNKFNIKKEFKYITKQKQTNENATTISEFI